MLTLLLACVEEKTQPGKNTEWFETTWTYVADTYYETSYCGVYVQDSYPAGTTGDVFYRSPLWWRLNDETVGVVELENVDGEVIEGETANNEGVVVFHPSRPLEPNSFYAATLKAGCLVAETEFWTSALGEELTVSLMNVSYELSLGNATWVSPPNTAFLVSILQDTSILFMVKSGRAETIDMRFAGGLNGEQYMCSPTADIDDNFWEDPYFEVTAPFVVFDTPAFPLDIDDFAFSGAFASDGSFMGGGHITGVLDTRDLGEVVGLSSSSFAVCELLATFYIPCVECPDTLETCLQLDVRGITAPRIYEYLEEVTVDEAEECEPF